MVRKVEQEPGGGPLAGDLSLPWKGLGCEGREEDKGEKEEKGERKGKGEWEESKEGRESRGGPGEGCNEACVSSCGGMGGV